MAPDKKEKKTQIVIKHIVERFLNPQLGYSADQFPSINKICELPLHALRGVTAEESQTYSEVFGGLKTIKDMAALDYNHPLNRLIPPQTDSDIEAHVAKCEKIISDARAKIGDMEKLRNSILISNMIASAWEKRDAYLTKQETKVITIGLDNAGKTAILSALGGKMGLDALAELKPTKKIERRKITTDKLSLLLWDFGGQQDYRDLYLSEPEKYFIKSDLIMYVIDMQDPERYDLSFNYFTQILDIMIRLNEKPYVLCFLHKSDPDLLNDATFQLQLDFVKTRIKTIMEKFPFDYDVYATSIYNFFTSEPKFSKFIKDVMSKEHQSLNDPTLERIHGLGQILDTTLNAVINLSSSVNEQITNMQYRLDNIERNMMDTRNFLISLQASMQGATQGAVPQPKTIMEAIAAGAAQAQSQPTIPANQAAAAVSRTLSAPPAFTPIPISSQLKSIEEKAMASRQTLQTFQAQKDASDDLKSQTNQTRSTILSELRVLFQKTKDLQ